MKLKVEVSLDSLLANLLTEGNAKDFANLIDALTTKLVNSSNKDSDLRFKLDRIASTLTEDSAIVLGHLSTSAFKAIRLRK